MDYFMHDLQNYEVCVVYYVDGGFPLRERDRDRALTFLSYLLSKVSAFCACPFCLYLFSLFLNNQPDLGIGFRVSELYIINLGPFDTNYIIFRNVEVFNNFFFFSRNIMYLKEN